MRKIIAMILLLAVIAVPFAFASEGPKSVEEIINGANKDLGVNHFVESTDKGKARTVKIEAGYTLVYGSEHGNINGGVHRYAGYTRQGEDFPHPLYPVDYWGGTKQENYNLIDEPWKENDVRKTYGIQQNNFDGDSKYLKFIQAGIKQFKSQYFIGESHPLWNQWHEYVHIVEPPTTWTYGLGRVYHYEANGSVWYLTIPLPAQVDFKSEPDFSVTLDKHEIEADSGDSVEVVATYKLNEGHTQNEKAILKAFHEVNGTQYPVTLEPVDPANQLNNHIIEFSPGETKQYKVKVKAQDTSSKIITKVWPAEAANDSDWSNNSDEAIIQVEPSCTDVSVSLTVEKFNNKIYGGDEFFMNATIKRGYDGPAGPVNVKNSLNGPGIMDKKSGTLTLEQGQSVTVSWLCKLNSPGTYSYKATVEPIGVVDCALGNNTSSFTLNVYQEINNVPEPDKIEGWLTD